MSVFQTEGQGATPCHRTSFSLLLAGQEQAAVHGLGKTGGGVQLPGLAPFSKA